MYIEKNDGSKVTHNNVTTHILKTDLANVAYYCPNVMNDRANKGYI